MFKVKSFSLFLLISIFIASGFPSMIMDVESINGLELEESESINSMEYNMQENTEDGYSISKEEIENGFPKEGNALKTETKQNGTTSSIKEENTEKDIEEPVEDEEKVQLEEEVGKEESNETDVVEQEVEESDSNSGFDVELNEGKLEESDLEVEDELDSKQVVLQQGLIDVGLLSGVKLIANHTVENGQDHISLKLSGRALLDIGVLKSTYVIFQLPPEITSVMDQPSLKATSRVPRILGLGNVRGTYLADDIIIESNQIKFNIKTALSISLLSESEFTLDFDISYLPPSYEEEYTFYGQMTEQAIDVNLIGMDGIGKAKIPAPDGRLTFHYIPETLAFETTGLPIRLTIIPRKEPDWAIIVSDTRREKSSWKVLAQAEPFTAIDSPINQLPNALIYMNEQQNKSIISSEAITVFFSEGGPDEITRVQWEENKGPLIQVAPGEALPGEYKTTITWTLVDAP